MERVVDEHPAEDTRLVLLRDGRWPEVAGVCCWRHSVHAAFGAAGASVEELTWQSDPPFPVDLGITVADKSDKGRMSTTTRPRSAGRERPGRLAWLPAWLRTPLAGAVRRARAVRQQRARRNSPAARHNQETLRRLTGARLVIAESTEAAVAAAGAGVPRQRVWALVLPTQRLHLNEPTGYGADVAGAAAVIGGLLTDSEPARDSLERAAAAAGRPRVEIFPPIAADRPCPAHHPTDPAAEPAADPTTDPAAGLLARWRRLLAAGATAGRFGADRDRSCWGGPVEPATATDPDPDPEPVPAPVWTAGAQAEVARRVWQATVPDRPSVSRPTRKALIAGFDLKFARELAERLGNRTDLAVTIDDWPHYLHGSRQTERRLQQAESIFAEWARANAVWYSRHKRPDQFLAVRLHRYELDAPYPAQIAIDNVDAVVYIAPLFGRRIRDELGWPQEKLVYIPNYLDLDWLDRPKLPGARFALGFVGLEWSRKRFDLALDLLARVRRADRRFTLVVRSTMPWRNPYAWADPAERDYAGRCFERIDHDPVLRDGVVFDEPGRDMARWFRRVGQILSTSDEEGSHASVGEGMASGAVPVVRPWPGAVELYDRQWVHSDLDAAAEAVLANADLDRWRAQAADARAEVRRSHNPAAVVAAWADLLHRDIERARGHFAEFVTTPPIHPTTPAPRRPAAWAER